MELPRTFHLRIPAACVVGGGREEMGEGRGGRRRSKVLPQKLRNIRGRKRKLPDSDSKRSLYARKNNKRNKL